MRVSLDGESLRYLGSLSVLVMYLCWKISSYLGRLGAAVLGSPSLSVPLENGENEIRTERTSGCGCPVELTVRWGHLGSPSSH